MLFIVEFFKYYLGLKTFFETQFKHKYLGAFFLLVYIVMVTVMNLNSTEKNLLMYGFVIVLIFLMTNTKFINLISIFFIITCFDEIVGVVIENFNTYSMKNEWISNNKLLVSSLVVLILIVTICIIRKYSCVKERNQIYYFGRKYIKILMVVVAVQLVFTVCNLDYAKDYIPNRTFYWFVSLLCVTTLLCIVFLIIFVLFVENVNERLEHAVKVEQKMKSLQKGYYEILLEKEKDTQKYRHDMNGHLICLRELANEDEALRVSAYIEELQEKLVRIQKKNYKTGNDMIDILLNYYILLVEGNVDVEISGHCLSEIEISETDLCTIYFNLLQNAVESLNKIDHNKCKKFKMILKQDQLFLSCQMINTIGYTVHMDKNGEIQTSKKDNGVHGLGIENVKRVVEENHGIVEFEVQKDLFVCKLMLKTRPINKKTDR